MAISSLPPGDHFDVEVWILLALSIVVVFVRCFARIQVTGMWKLKLDDWGMVVALALSASTTSAAKLFAATTNVDPTVNPTHIPVALAPQLANNGMTDEYRANLGPASVEYQLRVVGSKLHLVGWCLFVSTLWCLKLCIAVYYTRLTDGISHMRIRVQVAYAAIGVTYIVVMASILGACQPFNHYWQINPNPGALCMPAASMLPSCVVVVLDVLTDFYLLHIPILMLWHVQISQARKFFLIMLFGGAIFVITAGILRAYFILTGGPQGGAQAAFWGTREMFVAFQIGNIPIIYGGVTIWLRKFKGSDVYTRFRWRGAGWPGLKWLSGLSSQAGRGGDCAASEKPTPGKNLAILNGTGSTSRSDTRSDTDTKASGTRLAEAHPDFGIRVTGGTKVDVESVKGRESNLGSIESGGNHSRTDSDADLGTFWVESPSRKPIVGRASKLPSDERPTERSTLQQSRTGVKGDPQ